MHFFWASCFKHKNSWSDSVCIKGACPSVRICPWHELYGCAGKNRQCLTGLGWMVLVFGWHRLMRRDFFSMVIEALHVYIRCSIDFGYSEISRGEGEWVGSVSLLMVLYCCTCRVVCCWCRWQHKYELVRICWLCPRWGWWKGCQGRLHVRAAISSLPPALACGSGRCRRKTCFEFDVTGNVLGAWRCAIHYIWSSSYIDDL